MIAEHSQLMQIYYHNINKSSNDSSKNSTMLYKAHYVPNKQKLNV